MKQKMSRISGVGCVAAAFANGPGAELLLFTKFVQKLEKNTCFFSETLLYYASTAFVADWSSG